MAIIASHARALQRKIHAQNVASNILPREVAKTEDGTPIVAPLPTSVKVLTAFFVVLGVLILGEFSIYHTTRLGPNGPRVRHHYMADCCLEAPKGPPRLPKVPSRQLPA